MRFVMTAFAVLLSCNAFADVCVEPGADGGQTDGERCRVAPTEANESPPLPPGFVIASDGAFEDRVELSWADVPNANFYNVYVSDTPQSPLTYVGQTSMTFARVRGTAPGIVNTFWVFPENEFGESLLGSFDTGFIAASATPAMPTAVIASDGAFADRVRVTWSDVAGETFYQLFRCATPLGITCGEPIVMPIENTTRFDDMEAKADGSLAFYRMKACNENGCSNFSAANSGYRQAPLPDLIFQHGFE